MVKLILLIITLTLSPFVISQQFSNADFSNGSYPNLVLSTLPPSWQNVSASDSISQVPNNYQGLGDTPDLTNNYGPMQSAGIYGLAKSGNNFVSGVRGTNFQEGIKQTVGGFTIGKQYNLSFFQTVVKQSNCRDTSGYWNVYIDDNLVYSSSPSISNLSYDNPNLKWEERNFNFYATSAQHTFSFLPVDDDNNLSTTTTNIDAGLRMGIDDLSLFEIPLTTVYHDTTLCEATNFQVQLNYPNATYLWSDNSTSASNTFHGSTVKSVEITQPDSSFIEIYEVHFFDKQNAQLPHDTTLCQGQSILIANPQSNYNYLWQDSSSAQSFTVSTNKTLTYTINKDQCEFTDSMNITINDYPVISLTDTTLCSNEIYTRQFPTQYNYVWSTGTQGSNFTSDTSGLFTVQITDGNCSIQDSFVIEFVSPISSLNFSDTTLCFGNTLQLQAPQGNYSSTWNNGSNDQITIDSTGYYSLLRSNICGSHTDSIYVSILPQLNLELGNDFSLCPGETFVLDPQNNVQGNYTWQDGSTQSNYTVVQEGIYTLTLNIQNCTVIDSVEVNYIAPLELNLGNDTSVCSLEGLILGYDSNAKNLNFYWNNGETGNEIYVTEEGYYNLEVSNECELVIDEIYVSVENCSPLVFAPNAFSPNGDAHNGVFKFESENNFDRFEWSIYNRWGEEIFKGNSIDESWDGSYFNQACQDGSYVWKITYSITGSAYVSQETGIVNLLR